MVMKFPKLPELAGDRLSIEGGKSIWDIARGTEIGRWAFLVIRNWALNDHRQFFEFMLEFKKTEELHRWFLLHFHDSKRRERFRVTVLVEKEQGRDAAEHLLLLSLRGRGWHHFVGDLLFYTLSGKSPDGTELSMLEPCGLGLLEQEQ